MKRIAAIATMPGREEFLKKTIESLRGQVDEIRLYDNGKESVDLTDNGKFYFLKEYNEPVYYFSCDDDIIYPPTYIRDMIAAIDRYKSIVTHHGRKLTRKGVSYYRGGHVAYRCTGHVTRARTIDVAGTGVTGFRTDYFNPVNIYKSKHKCMSDLVFSMEARKQKKMIVVLPHKAGYIQAQKVPREKTIFGNHVLNDAEQSALADELQSLGAWRPSSKP